MRLSSGGGGGLGHAHITAISRVSPRRRERADVARDVERQAPDVGFDRSLASVRSRRIADRGLRQDRTTHVVRVVGFRVARRRPPAGRGAASLGHPLARFGFGSELVAPHYTTLHDDRLRGARARDAILISFLKRTVRLAVPDPRNSTTFSLLPSGTHERKYGRARPPKPPLRRCRASLESRAREARCACRLST